MADAAVQEAIYRLRYEGGDSVRTLTSLRQAAEQAASSTDKLATTEERLGKSSLNLLASLDPRIRAEQAAARQLEHFSRLHADGAITVDRYASTLKLVENNLKTKVTAMDGAVSTTARLGDSIGGLVTRYTSWATIIIAVRRLAQEAIRTDVEAAAAVDRLGESYTRLAQNLAPTIAWLTDQLTALVNHTNNVVKGIKDAVAEIGRSPLLGGAGGITIPMTARPDSISAGFDSKSRNWTPGAAGFPTSGFTDLRAEDAAKEQERMLKERLKEQLELHKGFWSDVREVENNAYERSVKEAGDYWKDVDKKREADAKELDDFHDRAEQAWEKHYERIFKEADDYWKDVDKLREESGRDYERQLEREREQVKRYWDDVALDLTGAGKSFWMEFAATGKANFKDLFADLKATFARVLYEMIIEAKLKPIILNIIGKGGAGGTSGGGGLLGLGLLGGDTDGGGFGGFLSKWLAPIALGVGLVASLFKQKPSDMRSVATFVPGMTDYGVGPQSAHETSQATLTAAQQAADAIRLEVLALKEAGVQFTQQLSNIWIGERDESTFQFAGGQRIGVGSVGDPTDLAVDVLTALLKGATSNDPKIQAILSGGGSSQAIASALAAVQQAKDFTDAIQQAILGIKDPLKAALELWRKESEARLAAATALGANIDQVKELNALLYQQMITQQNAGALSSIGGLIDQLEYGPGSSAAPNKQYASALKDYEAAKKAAMGGGAAEAMAYAQTASSFLPFAREYLGTSVGYGRIETDALNTLKGLQTSLGTSTMPSLQPVVTQIAVSSATEVEAIKENTTEVREMKLSLDRSNAIFGSLMARFAASTP